MPQLSNLPSGPWWGSHRPSHAELNCGTSSVSGSSGSPPCVGLEPWSPDSSRVIKTRQQYCSQAKFRARTAFLTRRAQHPELNSRCQRESEKWPSCPVDLNELTKHPLGAKVVRTGMNDYPPPFKQSTRGSVGLPRPCTEPWSGAERPRRHCYCSLGPDYTPRVVTKVRSTACTLELWCQHLYVADDRAEPTVAKALP